MALTRPPEVPIRLPAAAALVLLLASPLCAAFKEIHVDEITAPVSAYVANRVAALEALPTRTAAEKKELKLLKPLAKKLAKTAFALKQDFAELAAAGVVFDKLGAAVGGMDAPEEEAVARAGLSLSERVELCQDYLVLLTVPKHRTPVQKALTAVTTARTAAAAAFTEKKRTAQLAKADAAVTDALKKADKFVLLERGADSVPLPRLRSGDAVGFGGGRIAVPRDAVSPIAGASILFPHGFLQNDVNVTLAPAPSFVGGKDLSAGPAIAVGPDGFALAAGVSLFTPYQLPGGTSATELALLGKGPPATTTSAVIPLPDGTLRATITSFTTYEPAIPSPPPGQPGGTYHVQTFVVRTTRDATGTASPEIAALLVGVQDQTATFRPDHTASTSLPGFPFVVRSFLRAAAPHHDDGAQFGLTSPADFTWTAGGPGRFTFSLPLGGGIEAPMQGSASDDGRVVTWSGRGDTFEFLAVGVKVAQGNATADLAGRWAAVEIGAQFLDDGAEPFRTLWHDSLRSFTASTVGVVTFDAAGQRFETELTYHTDQPEPLHTRTEAVVGDGGNEVWNVGANGFTGAAGKRSGWFDKDAGFLTSVFFDQATNRIALMVAVPQPATGDPLLLPGLYNWAGMDVATSVVVPADKTSTHDVTPLFGSLDVADAATATLSTGAASRVAYTLTTTPPANTFRWLLSSDATAVPASSGGLTLSLDAAGNHTAAADPFWYSFAGDGRYVLRLTRGDATNMTRGIAVGLR